jgi:homoserine kinase
VIARVPGSSANLGPGFDTLGMAISLHAELGIINGLLPAGARRVEERHPGQVAFQRAGGEGALWERCDLPMGRGLGFSGAVRVGGAMLGVAQSTGVSVLDDEMRTEVLALTTDLEGHADNVAASLYGGVVAAAAGRVVRVPVVLEPAVIVWIPSFITKTDESRRVLPDTVSFADAVFNVGRVALLVAALAAGDVAALRAATDDRLHQSVRLARAQPSRAALEACLEAGAWCSWLSGSGPTVAALCAPADAAGIAASLPADGRTKVLRIDNDGALLADP